MGASRRTRPKGAAERSASDRELGLFAPITRRDLLHGVAVGALGAMAPPLAALAAADEFAPEQAPGYYPPALTGLRGNHPGSFEVAHERAWGGREWRDAERLDERYDLVVVGAGISGLAAAYFYRRAAGGDARILLLDNHDDFGGHAKRNELHHDGRAHLALGGSVFLEYGNYGDVTHGLLRELGVDIGRLHERQDRNFIFASLGLDSRIYFDADSFAADRLVGGRLLPLARRDADGEIAMVAYLDRVPVSEAASGELRRFLTRRTDYLAAVPDPEKARALSRLSYRDFLREHAGLSEEAARVFHRYPHANFGVGTDAISAYDGLLFGLPGWQGLGGFGREAEAQLADRVDELVGAWFPDGNASIPRLLVRSLVPGAAPGRSQEDVVGARFDYAALDRPGAPVRVRLNSTAVHVDPLPGDGGVDVTYVRGGRAYRVRGRNCVLACYNAMVPYLCPSLPKEQKEALRYGEKTPLVSSNVLLREGRVLERLGCASFYSPGRLHSMAWALGRSLGRYEAGWNPDAPLVLHMMAATAPATPGATMREQLREGRRQMLGMSFTDFEREIREHLAGMLGPAGFEPARDVIGLTVNRWPHGYAYERNPLFDPEWPAGEAPNEIGRRRLGRVTIANSDAAYHAYVDGAVDQAERAVGELVAAGLV